MSQHLLIEWFDQLLFGHNRPTIIPPPCSLHKLVHQLDMDGISWHDMIHQGGLTNFRYQIQGDLERFLDFVENDNQFPVFKTRAMTMFFKQYQVSLARRPKPPLLTDDDTLHNILSGHSGPFQYHSAEFWGELARSYINLRRALPKDLTTVSEATVDDRDRTHILYDVTCESRGERVDPLSMVMVPSSEYVDAVHWESPSLLESFLKSKPKHALARSVKHLVMRALNQLLEGCYPSCLNITDSKLSTFLRNVSVIHETVPEVTVLVSPPRLIDVFQRLLALAHLDDLWQTCGDTHVFQSPVTDTLRLTERLLLAERQNQFLLKHIICE